MTPQQPLKMLKYSEYTRYAHEEIESTNFYLLKNISLLSTAMLALALAALMITGAALNIVIFCATTFALHLSLCVIVHARAEQIIGHMRVVHAITLGYLWSLLLFSAYFCTYGTANIPGVFFAPIVIVLTMVFILPVWQGVASICGATIVFVWMSFLAKAHGIFMEDLLIALSAVIFSLTALYELYIVRIREYHLQSELMRRSSTDGLTGLMNKITAETSAKEYLQQYADEQSSALMVIDLDQFKLVNDQMGHQAGDEALESFGETLLKLFRTQDIVGRVGGDEFLVLMKNIDDPEMVVRRAEVICESASVIHIKGFGRSLSCSIGIAMCPYHGKDYETLFGIADEQLYMLKRNAKALTRALN